MGDAGTNGGEAGDLIIVLRVAQDKFFERDGDDLYCAVPISLSQAALGADITISTLDDRRITLKIPSGTPNGKILKIKEEGVPHGTSGKKGDLYFKVVVELPAKLTREQQRIMEEYAKFEKATTSPSLIPLSQLR